MARLVIWDAIVPIMASWDAYLQSGVKGQFWYNLKVPDYSGIAPVHMNQSWWMVWKAWQKLNESGKNYQYS